MRDGHKARHPHDALRWSLHACEHWGLLESAAFCQETQVQSTSSQHTTKTWRRDAFYARHAYAIVYARSSHTAHAMLSSHVLVGMGNTLDPSKLLLYAAQYHPIQHLTTAEYLPADSDSYTKTSPLWTMSQTHGIRCTCAVGTRSSSRPENSHSSVWTLSRLRTRDTNSPHSSGDYATSVADMAVSPF